MKLAKLNWLMIGLVSVALLTLPLIAEAKNAKPSAYDLILQQEIDALNAAVNNLTSTVNNITPSLQQQIDAINTALNNLTSTVNNINLPHIAIVHGSSGTVQVPSVISNTYAFGWGLDFIQNTNTGNWIHFSIPVFQYPVVQIMLNFYTGADARVDAVHVYNGGIRVKVFDGPWSGGHNPMILNLDSAMVFQNGLGISVGVSAGTNPPSGDNHRITFSSAGAILF